MLPWFPLMSARPHMLREPGSPLKTGAGRFSSHICSFLRKWPPFTCSIDSYAECVFHCRYRDLVRRVGGSRGILSQCLSALCLRADPYGDYGLPLTLEVLNDHGLRGVFFVEPLFAARFGRQPLQELVGLIQEAGQEIQLHLHTQWVDDALEPLLPNVSGKRQHLRLFSRAEQVRLIAVGLDLLRSAGESSINAFRAGNFALNQDTLYALGENALNFDSSYNGVEFVENVAPGELLTQPKAFAGVTEYPVTVFRDRGPGSLRPLQLTACSFREISWVLNIAADSGWDAIVIVSHNFELLNRRKDQPDPIVVKRFRQLCRYLEQHSDRFHVRGFRGLSPFESQTQPEPIMSRPWFTAGRARFDLRRRRLRWGWRPSFFADRKAWCRAAIRYTVWRLGGRLRNS